MAARATSCPCSERRSERMAPKGGAATEPGGDGRRRPGHRRGELRQSPGGEGRRRPGHRRGELRQSPGGEGRRRPGRSAQPREAWRSVLVGVQGSGGASSWASWEARTSNAQRKASGWLSARELSCQRESSTPMSSACSRYLVARETLEYRDAEPRGDGAGDARGVTGPGDDSLPFFLH